ncbi:hypothetical protein Scep_011985 [Stephania cephalantha]|uniref:Uncharacterized protein n=1 Tax=Stephania cephalantha TaxID=152367 RepID=A0AAP0P635_9MAGN
MPSCSCVNPPTFNIVNHIDLKIKQPNLLDSCDIDVILLRRISLQLIFPGDDILEPYGQFFHTPNNYL